jgi:hypothetical protein
MGKIKRNFTCIAIDFNDEMAYLGTRTGDIIEIDLVRSLFKRIGPAKRLFSLGINCIDLLQSGDLLIGAGDGTSATTTGGIIGSSVDAWEWSCVTSLQEFPPPLSIQYV